MARVLYAAHSKAEHSGPHQVSLLHCPRVRLKPSTLPLQVMQDIAARSRSSGGGGARRRDWLDDDDKVVATGGQPGMVVMQEQL